MNSTAKKQNRILLVTLVVILSAAAILIAVTGSANRKSKSETEPPVETSETSADSAKSKPSETASRVIKPAETEETEPEHGRVEETKSETSAETEDREAAAIQTDTLPKFSAPVNGMVLKDYSDDLPVFSYTMNDYRTHTGLDFACSPGTPVYASADGVICEVASDPMMGVTVSVQHSGGAVTRYMGLSEDSLYLTQPGQNIKVGQVIGASGDTALIESAEEGHVHFELIVDGEHKNPADYMKVSYLADTFED